MPDVSFSAIDASSTIRNFSAFDPGDEVLVPYRRTSPDQQAELVNGLQAIESAISGIGGANAVATAAAPTYTEAADVNLSVNLGGDLRVISKPNPGSAWPVTGNFYQATQPVSGTFWQATQPVSLASVPLATGASTVAAQTAVTGSKAPGTAAASSVLTGGVFSSSPPTLTNGQQAAFQMDAAGRLLVTSAVPSGGNVALGAINDLAWTGTGDGTLISISKATFNLLNTPLPELAKTPLLATSDLTRVFDSSSATTERPIVAATAGQTTKGYFIHATAAGATTLEFLDGSAGAVLWSLEFPDKGAYIFDLMSRPYFKGTVNTALFVKSSAPVKTTVTLLFVKSA